MTLYRVHAQVHFQPTYSLLDFHRDAWGVLSVLGVVAWVLVWRAL